MECSFSDDNGFLTCLTTVSEEQFYDIFRTVLEPALLTVLAVEPALLVLFS